VNALCPNTKRPPRISGAASDFVDGTTMDLATHMSRRRTSGPICGAHGAPSPGGGRSASGG